MTNILITGASGFIGKRLIRMLNEKKKYNIILLTSSPINGYTYILHKGYSFNKCDFEISGITEIDYLIHLGAFIPKDNANADDIVNCNLNIENTKYLLDNIPFPKKKIIYISTTDVYGYQNKIIDENTAPNPKSLYALSKLYCEKMIKKISSENGISMQILRLGHIYGNGENKYKKFIPIAIQSIKNDHKINIFSDGKEKRSFLHVEDCCTFIIRALEMQEIQELFNLTSEYAFTIKHIAEILASFSDQAIDIHIQNKVLNTSNYIFDSTKRKKYLGIEKINIEVGLKEEYMGF